MLKSCCRIFRGSHLIEGISTESILASISGHLKTFDSARIEAMVWLHLPLFRTRH